MRKNKYRVVKRVSLKEIANDDLSIDLWNRCVTKEEQKDPEKMKALLASLIMSESIFRSKNPIVKRMIKDGAGFDGLNATGMTITYLRCIAKFYLTKATK